MESWTIRTGRQLFFNNSKFKQGIRLVGGRICTLDSTRLFAGTQSEKKFANWLERAAKYPRTFYGIISIKILGLENTLFNWEKPILTKRHEAALERIAAGRRALGLFDAGQFDLGRAELRRINPKRDQILQEAVLALSLQAGVPDLSMRLGGFLRSPEGQLYDSALYPDIAWRPHGGMKVDRALVSAFIRQESRFIVAAKNRSSGARGLMQIMPATARHVARVMGFKVKTSELNDPPVNISLGQKYLDMLMDDSRVDGNLFKLAVAYNAGPGKLARWEREINYSGDPLLFIESIPVSETRIFVERVMANYWIYRLKYGQRTPSLDRVAKGGWPVYIAQDLRRGKYDRRRLDSCHTIVGAVYFFSFHYI